MIYCMSRAAHHEKSSYRRGYVFEERLPKQIEINTLLI